MESNPIDELSIATLPSSARPSNELGQQEFLQMLIAQLENQDPLNPQEATEFTAQLATFSSLEQLVGINEGMEKLLSNQGGGDGLRGVEVIGKTILAEGEQFAVDAEGSASPLIFDLANQATATNVRVYDANGHIVAQAGNLSGAQGRHRITLEALRPGEDPLPPGIYSYEVEAVAGNTAVPVRQYIEGLVTGASVGGATSSLYLNDLVVPLDRVVEVTGAGS